MRLRSATVFFILGFSKALAQDCPLNQEVPYGSCSKCPEGSRVEARLNGQIQHNEIICLSKKCTSKCIPTGFGTAPTEASPSPPITSAPPPKLSCAPEELARNFKWIHDDATKNSATAAMRKNILRAISVTYKGDIVQIRRSYKHAQRHNGPVAELIDRCNDEEVGRTAYEFAENVVRTKACSLSPVANSAGCFAFVANFRWALVESGQCALFARYWMKGAVAETYTLKERAERVRRALMVAQGHNIPVAHSVDYIGDNLLVTNAIRVWNAIGGDALPNKRGDPNAEADRQNCPGIILYKTYE